MQPPPPPSSPEPSSGEEEEEEMPLAKQRCSLTPNRQSAIAVAYERLPGRRGSAEWRRAHENLCVKYGVNARYPARVSNRLATMAKLPASRKGVGGRPQRVGEEEEEALQRILYEHAYNLTFTQIEEKTGLPRATVCRFMKKNHWRIVGKSTRPVLTESVCDARLEWARDNLGNPWECHIDLDEKWFYVYSHSGKLKLPPGVKKPKQKLSSKRFIGKVLNRYIPAVSSSMSQISTSAGTRRTGRRDGTGDRRRNRGTKGQRVLRSDGARNTRRGSINTGGERGRENLGTGKE